jgi:hypothetical protein
LDEGELEMEDATAALLSDLVNREGQKFGYEYDFGDGWEHEILIEKIEEVEAAPERPQAPVCLKGKRACPPDDVGGPWGYAQCLEALADPSHERHEELSEWLGAFDPEAFDLEEVNEELARVGEEDEDEPDEDESDEDGFEEDERDEDELEEDEAPGGRGRQGATKYPAGTVAYYGPDDQTTTKIVAGVVQAQGAEPILQRWVGTGVAGDAKVAREIADFLQAHSVKSVAVADGVMGCPHEEGEDFPVGGDCPFCPFWKGKQGSGAKE